MDAESHARRRGGHERGVWGVDRVVAELAGRQHGVVTRRQLLGLGVGREAIRWRLENDRLHPVFRGVYLVGDRAAPPLALEAAAILACGPATFLSHHAAAHLQRLVPRPFGPVHVTVVGRALARRPGLEIHRCGTLDPEDRDRLEGLPLTAPARTLLDLAAFLSPDELEPLVAEAQRRLGVSDRSLYGQLDRHPGRRGAQTLRAVLELPGGPALTRSTAERRLVSLLRSARLPPPQSNRRVGGLEVDLLWPDRRLVAEFDSFAFHGDRRAFERDRHRDGVLQAMGYAVVRITWRQLTETPEAVVALLASMLERRRPRDAA